jgi:membrane dipeptidase
MKRPMSEVVPIVDGHLDLAENVTIFGRDLTSEVNSIRTLERRSSKQAMVTLPELERGNIAVAFATVTPGFIAEEVGDDFEPESAIYRTPEQAEIQAMSQIDLYEQWDKEGRIRIIRSVDDLENHLQLWQMDRKTGLVLLMEGADPVVEIPDLPRWWQRGLRIIGLTFGDTQYGAGVAGGSSTFKQGGLTPKGAQLLHSMAELGFIWDISHLTEEGMWQGLDLDFPHVGASHANVQALTPTNRHLSDNIIRAVARRAGVIGLVLYNGFLEPKWEEDHTIEVSLGNQLRRHAAYIADLTDWSHVGIGSDLDGGLGLEESPVEIKTVADLGKIGDVVPPEAREAVLGGNWLRFLRRSLPQHSW